MSTTNWHKFYETDEGDDQCGSCRVVVSTEAHMTFSLPCPAGDCLDPKNPDGCCVFVPKRSEASCCIYCGRPGDAEPLPPDLASFETWLEEQGNTVPT